MYADDSSVTSYATTVKDLEKKLNEDMTSASEWCTDNCMLANASKTKAMLITTWQKHASLPEQDRILKVTLNDTQLDKLLGVHISNNLSLENHINSILSKVNRNIALLRRIKSYLTVDVRKMFFNTNILPHLDYCTIIWGNSSQIIKLLKAQKRAARVILDVRDLQTPSSEMFKSLNWMPLRDRVTYRKTCIMYKSLNCLAPIYMSEMMKYVHESNSRNTRTSARNDLSLRRGKHKDIYINSLAYSGAKIWNDIPTNIRNAVSLESFKGAYLRKYFN